MSEETEQEDEAKPSIAPIDAAEDGFYNHDITEEVEMNDTADVYEVEDIDDVTGVRYIMKPNYHVVKAYEQTDKPIPLDKNVSYNILSMAENARRGNGDLLIVVDGGEGLGKSTHVRQLATLADPDFTEAQIYFTREDLVEAMFKGLPKDFDPPTYLAGKYEAKPFRVLVLDEAKADLDRKKTMSSGNIGFANLISQSRQLHILLFICLPSIHDLDGYISQHRANALIHCEMYSGRKGFAKFYNRSGIKSLFVHKVHSERGYTQAWSFRYRFSSRETCNLERYNQFKAAAIERFRPEGENSITPVDEVGLKRKMMEKAIRNCIEKGLIDTIVIRAMDFRNEDWFTKKRDIRKELGIPYGDERVRMGKRMKKEDKKIELEEIKNLEKQFMVF